MKGMKGQVSNFPVFYRYRRVDVRDIIEAHFNAALRAPQLGFEIFIVSALFSKSFAIFAIFAIFEILRFCDFAILRFCYFATLRFCDFAILRFCDFANVQFCDFVILRFYGFRFFDFSI
jgi:hypothetical protein